MRVPAGMPGPVMILPPTGPWLNWPLVVVTLRIELEPTVTSPVPAAAPGTIPNPNPLTKVPSGANWLMR